MAILNITNDKLNATILNLTVDFTTITIDTVEDEFKISQQFITKDKI